jgi:hypothetical protein
VMTHWFPGIGGNLFNSERGDTTTHIFRDK